MDIKEFIEYRNQKLVNKKFPSSFYYMSEYPNQDVYQQLLFLVSEMAQMQNTHVQFLKDAQSAVQTSVFDAIDSLEKKIDVIRSQIAFLSRNVLESGQIYGSSSIQMINLLEGDFDGLVYQQTDNGIIFENAINTYNIAIEAKDKFEKLKTYGVDSRFYIVMNSQDLKFVYGVPVKGS